MSASELTTTCHGCGARDVVAKRGHDNQWYYWCHLLPVPGEYLATGTGGWCRLGLSYCPHEKQLELDALADMQGLERAATNTP